ncbi:MAG: hypothetical protein ACXWQR_15675 [Ktedonobacterales bacterium]
MGKALSFVMALGDLGLLALLVASRHRGLLQDAGLFASFVVFAVGAWLVAVVSALFHGLRFGTGWRWFFALIVLLWLPAVPAFFYGVSGTPALVRQIAGKGHSHNTSAAATARVAQVAAKAA